MPHHQALETDSHCLEGAPGDAIILSAPASTSATTMFLPPRDAAASTFSTTTCCCCWEDGGGCSCPCGSSHSSDLSLTLHSFFGIDYDEFLLNDEQKTAIRLRHWAAVHDPTAFQLVGATPSHPLPFPYSSPFPTVEIKTPRGGEGPTWPQLNCLCAGIRPRAATLPTQGCPRYLPVVCLARAVPAGRGGQRAPGSEFGRCQNARRRM